MSFAALLLATALIRPQQPQDFAPGRMWIESRPGVVAMPMTLKHTDIQANVAGFGARVTVHQSFSNPCPVPIEATYTFPLPDDAAVDKMTIHIGERTVEGVIKERGEARVIYEQAKASGQTAALLNQERSNVFTQAVANIMPGVPVDVEISYVETLKYTDGQFEFHFPMVVGPRYTDSNTPDARKVTPPIISEGMRTGQDVSLNVNIDAGAPIEDIVSVLHQVTIVRPSKDSAQVCLTREDEIPNRDFILRFRVAADAVKSAFVSTYTPGLGGHFQLIVLPPRRPTPAQISPREMIFVIDRSGSQTGFPLEKSKELTLKLIKKLHPGDTFNVISFGLDSVNLWPSPQPYSSETLLAAESFIRSIQAGGGTDIRQGVLTSLNNQSDGYRLRIVLLNTDGFVGNENQVLQAIRNNRGNARVFTFGIGNSVNRYIIDAMAAEGRGDAEYVTLAEQADGAVNRLVKRLDAPVLTNITADFGSDAVQDITPNRIPDLFDETPIVIMGKYTTPGWAKVTLHGMVGGVPWTQTMDLKLSGAGNNDSVATMWARKRITDLERSETECQVMGEAVHQGVDRQELNLALQYGIMSSKTSFVAVEPRIVNFSGRRIKVRVPVEMASGVSYEGIYGNARGTATSSTFGISVNGASGPGGGGFGGAGAGFPGGLGRSGGPGGAPPSTGQVSQNVLRRIQLRSVDPALFKPAVPADKVAQSLKKVIGKVEVQIDLSVLDESTLKKLSDAGLTIEDKEKDLKVVFGTLDAKDLLKLAALIEVQRIEPVEELKK